MKVRFKNIILFLELVDYEPYLLMRDLYWNLKENQ